LIEGLGWLGEVSKFFGESIPEFESLVDKALEVFFRFAWL